MYRSEAQITPEGWTLEVAIPFTDFGYGKAPTGGVWGFNATRFIRRRNESIRWASPSRDVSFNSVADAGILEGITDIRQGYGIDIKPYSLATVKRRIEFLQHLILVREPRFEVDKAFLAHGRLHYCVFR